MDNKMNARAFSAPANDETEIDLIEIFGLLMHWIWLILIVGIISGAAGYLIARFALPEEFTSTTTVYILNKSDNSGAITQTEMQAGAQLTKDYNQLITSRTVLEYVISELGLQDQYTYEQFKSKISVSSPTDTRLINISVTDTDPQLARQIADQIRIVASEHIQKVMQIEAVNLVDAANLPTQRSAPSRSRWALIWAMIGVLGISAILILRHILDDTIKTSDDVERYLGLSTLALVPLDANVGEKAKGKGRKRKEKDSAGTAERQHSSNHVSGSHQHVSTRNISSSHGTGSMHSAAEEHKEA